MESNTNNISSAGLHRLDQRQRRSGTSEEVDVRQGQNALGSLLLSTGLTPSHGARLWLVGFKHTSTHFPSKPFVSPYTLYDGKLGNKTSFAQCFGRVKLHNYHHVKYVK